MGNPLQHPPTALPPRPDQPDRLRTTINYAGHRRMTTGVHDQGESPERVITALMVGPEGIEHMVVEVVKGLPGPESALRCAGLRLRRRRWHGCRIPPGQPCATAGSRRSVHPDRIGADGRTPPRSPSCQTGRTWCRRSRSAASSTYYRWRRTEKEPCERRRRDAELTEQIRQIHAASGGNYGSPRVHAVLNREGVHVGRKRVERLMREADITGVSPRRGVRRGRGGRARGAGRQPP
ncbi:IS3 family transposase [Streptomyces atratus]|uniref:IS3 family transposase n=1 Tax=Streptomyces atratus TaxID=1893 RepID=UPI003F6A0108